MDPTEDEANAITDLAKAFDWAGVSADVRTTLGAALGGPTLIRDIAFIPRGDWDNVITRLKGLGAAVGDGDPPERELTVVDKSRLESFRRVCFRRVGATPDTPGTPAPPAPAATGGPPAPLATNSPSRKLKLSAVVDQTLEAEVNMLTNDEVDAMYREYKQTYGDVPSPEAEPTVDQLSAVKMLIASKVAPYVDFAVFGPHGLRLLRKLTFSSFAMNASGEWQRRELPGPPSYEGWFEIFRVFRTTFLLLGAASAERLDSYCEHIRSLHSRFGPECWDLIYMADVHMRSEQFERIRRRLENAPEFGYTSISPWSAVLAQSVREDAFWSKEVITPATLRLAERKAKGGADASSSRPRGSEGGDPPANLKGRKRKVSAAEDASKHDGKQYTHNRRGVEICLRWNDGKCGVDKPQSKCSAKPPRSHQCSKCLGPHQARSCTK